MDRSGPNPGADRRSQLVVVAIPSENDPVWNVSSEKVPHMTLLYLGEDLDISDVDVQHVTEHVEYAASLLTRVGMGVDRRGTLGPKDADVLYFDKSYDWKKLVQFRHNLLTDNVTSKLYNSASQFPEWIPHLTLGFPETPAKKDTRDYPGFSWVNFDRIALWTADSAGPTFVLKEGNYAVEESMAQSQGAAATAVILEHYGVKGMHWGKRKAAIAAARSPESTTTASIKRKAKTTKVSSLTNEELQSAINRMNLEKQFNSLTVDKTAVGRGKKAVKSLLGAGRTANDVVAFNNSPAGKILREKLKQ